MLKLKRSGKKDKRGIKEVLKNKEIKKQRKLY